MGHTVSVTLKTIVHTGKKLHSLLKKWVTLKTVGRTRKNGYVLKKVHTEKKSHALKKKKLTVTKIGHT